jgi:hypothetical protein
VQEEEEIIRAHWCETREKGEYNEALQELFVDFKQACDSIMGKLLCNYLVECGIPVKLVSLIEMCLSETYRRMWVGRLLSDMFPVMNGLKQGDPLLPLLFNFALEYAIRTLQVNQDGMKLNGTHYLMDCADDVSALGRSVHTVTKNTAALLVC